MSFNDKNTTDSAEQPIVPDAISETTQNTDVEQSDPTQKSETDTSSETSSEESTHTDADGTSLPENPAPHNSEQISVAKFLFDYVEMFSIALCGVLLIFMFAFRVCDVRGESMEKTLYENEKLLISNLFYTPERGDIIIFHQTGTILNEPIVKRVIATGGEWIDIEFQTAPQKITIKIYDEHMNLIETLDESEYAYLNPLYPMRLSDFEYPMQIPDGYLFVLGDNRNKSTDSRSHIIGLVDERRVLGKVLMRIYPFSVAGAVD